MTQNLILADWPAPANIKAMTTTRLNGASQGAYASFNVASHVADNTEHVAENRRLLRERLSLPAEPLWLDQVHGNHVYQADQPNTSRQADAVTTQQIDAICAILTADCLPLLLCNQQGTEVAAIHAGWRGLASGVIDKTVECMSSTSAELMVWLGPAIGPRAFEVGPEVQQQFCVQQTDSQQAFKPSGKDRYFADIYQLARLNLARLGVRQIYGGEYCSYSDSEHFYSYRRDGQTGRMASLIWIQNRGGKI